MRKDPDLAFDAVLFDLDGTLVATDRFWPDAARAGALQAFTELGLEREPPGAEVWMGMVGLSLQVGFEQAFPDLTPDQRAHLMGRCVEAEHRLLEEGRAGFLPGVEATLERLSRAGLRLGIASNCSQAYLDAMLGGLGLDRWVLEGRCLDSRGVHDKADMVEDLLLTFGTRSALMVGDRRGDRDAAWANGLPHVHLSRGYAAAGERVEAEATLEGLDQLPALLGERARQLDGLLAQLELPAGACALGVTGPAVSGKSLLARDLAERLEAAGRAVELVRVDEWLRPEARGDGTGQPLEAAGAALDLAALERVLGRRPGRPDEVRVVEGPFLEHPAVRKHLARLVHLAPGDRTRERWAAGREGRLAGPAAAREVLERFAPLELALARALPPGRGDRVIDPSNPLRPLG